MNGDRETDAGVVVSHEVGVRCTSEDCQFELQVGVFGGSDAVESLFATLAGRETCPACGATVEEWTPRFAGAIPGRPAEW